MYNNYKKLNYQNNEVMLSGRELEAHILTKMSNKLRTCKKDWENKEILMKVLEENQLLWSIFQENMENDDCTQPNNIRLNILRLIKFIDTRTFQIMSNELPDADSMDMLIDINNSIAKGLRTHKEE
jgi:flagellar biosynthesis activator protein FlaF